MSLVIVATNPTKALDSVDFHFNLRLNWRGSDFSVYANTGYKPVAEDSLLLQQIFRGLFQNDSGVNNVEVTCYRIRVKHSQAVDAEQIIRRVIAAAKRAGYKPTVR